MKKNFTASITCLGGETTALALGPDGVARGAGAKLSPGDEFKAHVGAILALCRAMQVNPVEACMDVAEALRVQVDEAVRIAGVFEYLDEENKKPKVKAKPLKVKPKTRKHYGMEAENNATVGAALKRKEEVRLQAVSVANRPLHLGEAIDCGEVGRASGYADVDGKLLYTGDLVIVDHVRKDGAMRHIPGLHYVVKWNGKYFVHGIAKACLPSLGLFREGWKVRKVKPYDAVEIGEEHDGIAACRKLTEVRGINNEHIHIYCR